MLGKSQHPVYVTLGLLIGGYLSAIFFHRPRPGIIGRQRHFDISVKAVQHLSQVTRSAIDIFRDIKRISDAKRFGRCRHQLHQALGAGLGNSLDLEI